MLSGRVELVDVVTLRITAKYVFITLLNGSTTVRVAITSGHTYDSKHRVISFDQVEDCQLIADLEVSPRRQLLSLVNT